jgi:hypothetical protein
MSAHRIRSGTPLRTPSLKATNGHQEALHALLKGANASHLLARANYFFMIYKKTITPLTPHDNCKKKKNKVKKTKNTPLPWAKKINLKGYGVITL